MDFYFLALWIMILGVIAMAIYIAVKKLPGFTMKRDFDQLDEDHVTVRRQVPFRELHVEFSEELHPHSKGTKHEPKNIHIGGDFELPWGYGDNKIVLMTKDPHWLYAYWEITDERKKEIQLRHNIDTFEHSHLVLRVYDLSSEYNTKYFDIQIYEGARNWYINVGEADKVYKVALGRILRDGRFITMLESNTAITPKDKISDKVDRDWPPLEGLGKYYGDYNFNSVLSSEEFVKRENN